jgi:hypothetical protein
MPGTDLERHRTEGRDEVEYDPSMNMLNSQTVQGAPRQTHVYRQVRTPCWGPCPAHRRRTPGGYGSNDEFRLEQTRTNTSLKYEATMDFSGGCGHGVAVAFHKGRAQARTQRKT